MHFSARNRLRRTLRDFDMNKRILILICILLIVFSFSGCGSSKTKPTTSDIFSSLQDADSEICSSDTNHIEVDLTKSDDDFFSDREKDIFYSENTVSITLNQTSVTASDSSVKINGSTTTITQDGTYIISGSLENGTLIVDE